MNGSNDCHDLSLIYEYLKVNWQTSNLQKHIDRTFSIGFESFCYQFYMNAFQFLASLPNLCSTIQLFYFTMKKVIPLDVIQMSLSNVQTNDVVQTPPQMECRFCKQNENPQNFPNSFLSPCSCLQPIHSYCLADEMQKNMRGQIISNKPQKRYTCLKCQKNVRFLLSKQELREFAAKRRCFCFWLILCMVVMLCLLMVVVVIKATELNIGSTTITNNILIGLSIVVIVLFLLSAFFCLTQVLFEQRRKVSLLNSHSKQRRKFSSRIEIVDCP